MTQDFYREPSDDISQGDIFRNLPVYRADSQAVKVSRASGTGSSEIWRPDGGGQFVVLPASDYPALVVSHDCAIDKLTNAAASPTAELSEGERNRRSSKTDVLVAPIRLVPASWDEGQMERVAQGDVLHQFLVPPHAGADWGGGYADLRWLVTYRLSDLLANERILLLNYENVARLQTQLERFFSWRDGPTPSGAPPGGDALTG
jgi:hypothetical protein